MVVWKCLTWDFERHTEVNLDDWDVLHSRGFLVHLHRKNNLTHDMRITKAVCYCIHFIHKPNYIYSIYCNYYLYKLGFRLDQIEKWSLCSEKQAAWWWTGKAHLLRRRGGLDVERVVGLLLLSGFSPLGIGKRRRRKKTAAWTNQSKHRLFQLQQEMGTTWEARYRERYGRTKHK